MRKRQTNEPPVCGLTMPQAAHYLGVGTTTLYKLIAEGRLRTYTFGKNRRTTREWCDECIAKNECA